MSGDFFHKLTYNNESYEIRLATTISAIRNQKTLPDDVISRIDNKIAQIREEGEVSRWLELTERYNILAQKACLPQYDHFPEKKPVLLTLAFGVPRGLYAGTVVEADEKKKILLRVPLLPEALRNFSQKSFINCIQYKVREFRYRANEAQLAGIYNIATNTRISRIRLIPGNINTNFLDLRENTHYIHIYEKSIDEYILCILKPEQFANDQEKKDLIRFLENTLKKEEGRILQTEAILNKIETTLCGFESFGFNLPVTVLSTWGRQTLATEVPRPVAAPKAQISESTSEDQENTQEGMVASQDSPEKERWEPTEDVRLALHSEVNRDPENFAEGLLQIQVSEDRLLATIVNFRMAYYNNQSLSLDEAWFDRELRRLGVSEARIPEKQRKRALENLRRKRDITGITIAEGIAPIQAASPYIQKTNDQADQTASLTGAEQDTVSFRKATDHIAVKARQHIASILYRKPAIAGTDVFGQQVLPPPPGRGNLTWGPGVELLNHTDFIASRDGSARIRHDFIEVKEALVVEGDVNLSTGDIDFSGAVEILGNIEAGSTVRTGGNLTVRENICGKSVYAGGNIQADRGIITGKNGFLYAKGDISVGFIEHSTLVCTGNLEVKKSILLSNVWVEGNLIMSDPQGRIASSDIYVFGNMDATNVGSPGGKETIIHLGKYWRYEKILLNCRRRLQNFQNLIQTEEEKLEDFDRQHKGELTIKKQMIRQTIENRLSRLNRILQKISAMIQKVNSFKTTNSHSYAKISGTLSTNSLFVLADDRAVRPSANLAMVAISCEAEKSREMKDLKTFKPPERTLKPFNRFRNFRSF